MKRDQGALLADRTGHEVDRRKKRRVEEAAGEGLRLARAQEASRIRQQKMTHWLDKWTSLNAEAATGFEITAPEPNPLGADHAPLPTVAATPSFFSSPARLPSIL